MHDPDEVRARPDGSADGAGSADGLLRAQRRRMAERVPRFAALWLPSALVASYVLHAESLVALPGSLAAPLAHASILLAAAAFCRVDPEAPRVFAVVMATCIVLGVTTIGLFAAAGGSGDFLAFMLLTLYLLAALFFRWGWWTELALLVVTVVAWLLATPVLRFHVPAVELAAAIAIGSVIALAIAEGAARSFAAAFHHRTREEMSRQALETSRNAYRDLTEQAREPIFTAHPAGRFTYVNAAMARCLGDAEGALIGRAVADFLSDHAANRALRELLAAPAAKDERLPPLAFEVRTVHGLRWFETLPAVIRDAEGRVTGLRAICRDVTDRKRLEQERDAVAVREHAARVEAEAARIEAEAASRARDDFLAMLSHELRSPLSTILTWTRMLRRGLVDEERLPHALASIEKAATSQERLVTDLLDISGIAAGKLTLHLEPVDLADLLAGQLDALREAAGAKRIALEQDLDYSIEPVRGDPSRLRQVFENLLSNAVKFTPSRGRISVTLERVGEEVRATVCDTGIGIPADVLPRIFDEFQQADRSITRRYGGLGLGLAIARRLVELHGGRIEAESVGEGQGATFRVRLPLAERTPAGREAVHRSVPVPAQALSRLEGVRVLVVDDDPGARDLLTTLLSRCGADVRPAGSVREALDRFTRIAPDVVVTDIAMPGEDGYALLRELRAMERQQGGHVPAIAVTALASAEDQERSRVEGFDEHLTKPVDPGDLVDAVARRARRTGGPPARGRIDC